MQHPPAHALVKFKQIRGTDSICRLKGCWGRPRRCPSCRRILHREFVEKLPAFLELIAAFAPNESTVAFSLSAARGEPISVHALFSCFSGGKKTRGFLQRDFAQAINAILKGEDYTPPPPSWRSGDTIHFPSIEVMRENLARRHGSTFVSNVSPQAIKRRLGEVDAMRIDGLFATQPTRCILRLLTEAVAIAAEAEVEAETDIPAALKELEGLLHVAVACALNMRDEDKIKASETPAVFFAALELFRPSPMQSKLKCGNAMWWALLYHVCNLRPAFQAVHTAEALIDEAVGGMTYPAHLDKFNLREFKNVLASSITLSKFLPPHLRERLLDAYPRAMIAAVGDVVVARTLLPNVLCAGIFVARDALNKEDGEHAAVAVAVGLPVALSMGIPIDLEKLCEGFTAEDKGAMAQTLRAIGVIKAKLHVAAAMVIVAWDPRVDKGEWERVVRSIADEEKGEEALGLQAEFFVRNVDKLSVQGVMREFEKWSGVK